MTACPCVLCGEPDMLGLAVCVDCGGAAVASGDTLLFVRPEASRSGRVRAREVLRDVTAGRAPDSDLGLVAAGHRALLRVPAASADRVARELATRGIPAEARAAGKTWATVPLSFILLLVAALGLGLVAGFRTEPMLRWTSPLVVLALFLAAQVRLTRPAVTSPRRRGRWPRRVERTVVRTFAELPAGTARDLLARMVRTAESAYDVVRAAEGAVIPREIEQLVTYACRAARDLETLDGAAEALEGWEGYARAVALRDRMVSRFQHGVSVLHRLQVEAVASDPVHEELADLIAVLDADARAYAEAMAAVEQLVPSSRNPAPAS